MRFWKALLLLIFPGGVLFAAGLYLQSGAATPPGLVPLLEIFPLLAVAGALLLGWRFNRTRVIWTVLLLVLVDRALVLLGPYPREFLLAVAAVLLPLNLLLIGCWSERGIFTRHGLFRLVLFGVQFGLVGWLYRQWPGEVIARLGAPLVTWSPLVGRPLSQVAMLAVLLSLVGLALCFRRKPDPLGATACWVLACVAAGLCWPAQFAFWAGIAVLMLAIAIVEGGFSMAFNDELTDLPARRAMNEFLLKVGRRYTIAMVDVDHFKKVNDTHGHDVGDQVLRMVATCLRRVSGGGRAYRYGGEEFAVIFAGKDMERALPHLEELRENIAGAGFVLRSRKRPKQKPEKPKRGSAGKGLLQVTVSIGVAMRDDQLTAPEQVIKAADQALYRAKKGGRNRVCS